MLVRVQPCLQCVFITSYLYYLFGIINVVIHKAISNIPPRPVRALGGSMWCGAMVARLNLAQEVAGSSPAAATLLIQKKQFIGGYYIYSAEFVFSDLDF